MSFGLNSFHELINLLLRGEGKYLQDILSTVGRRMTVQMCTIHILLCICHYLYLPCREYSNVIILPTPENVKHHTTGQQRPILNCSLQLRLTVDSGTPRHPARSSTVHCQSELLRTIENTVFPGRWCGVCPNL